LILLGFHSKQAVRDTMIGHGTPVTTMTVGIGMDCHRCDGRVIRVQVAASFFGTRLAWRLRFINTSHEQ
jgi:hypothetical protein